MIVLDTNVVSGLMEVDLSLEPWLARAPRADLFLTVMTRAEIRYGIALLPAGRRRDDLSVAANAVFAENRDRLLAFESRAADRYGEIVAARRQHGNPISVQDAVIASIAWVHRARLATRNVRDFEDCGLEIVNPFEG